MRDLFIAGNWKMNKTVPETEAFFKALDAEGGDGVRVALCVPFTDLAAAVAAVGKRRVLIGAQNVSRFESGAYTGEVSAAMLADAGAGCVIIGHSERRAYFAETDEAVNAKLKISLAHGLTPIVCVGEALSQRDAGETFEHIGAQVAAALGGLAPAEAQSVVIAYEPIWAIGTGRTASEEQAQEVCAYIRSLVAKSSGADAADRVLILYGGSMNLKNAGGLLSCPDIDGGLIGGASLKPDEFSKIIKLSYGGTQ